jgi:hypothetical protein
VSTYVSKTSQYHISRKSVFNDTGLFTCGNEDCLDNKDIFVTFCYEPSKMLLSVDDPFGFLRDQARNSRWC